VPGFEPHGRTNLMLGSEPDGQFDWERRHAIPPVMGSGRGFRVSDFGKRRRARGVRMTMTMTMRMSRRAWGQKRLNAEGQRTQSIAKSTNLVPGIRGLCPQSPSRTGELHESPNFILSDQVWDSQRSSLRSNTNLVLGDGLDP